jgi:hypothetical protein
MGLPKQKKPGRPARSYSIEELEQKVKDLRKELDRLSKEYAEGRTTLPLTTEREMLRISRALDKENKLLQSRLADSKTERML